ncbi:MAG: trehalase family glycosidase [Pseudomonadota bacterium]
MAEKLQSLLAGLELADPVKMRLAEDLQRILKSGTHIVNGRLCVTGYSYGALYDWDLYFECLALAHLGHVEFAKNGVLTFLDHQQSSGFIPRVLAAPWQKPGQHFKPFLAQTAALYTNAAGDTEWLQADVLPRLDRYLTHWFSEHYHSKGDGLPVWNSADHSGMDNQDERAGALNSYVCQGVDLACYLVREFEAMARLYHMTDNARAANKHAERADVLRYKISTRFWCETDGFFYDRNVRTGGFIKTKCASSFAVLWVGAASLNQAKRLVDEHLLNPKEFWLKYPVASMSALEPSYRQSPYDYEACCNWKGNVWIPTNYYIFRGLLRYGFNDAAAELAAKTLAMLMNNDTTREYYDAETGKGVGLDPFWGWSILGYFMQIEMQGRTFDQG